MADYFIEGESLVAIADAIRNPLSRTDIIYPEQMASEVEYNLGNVRGLVGRTLTNIKHNGLTTVGPYAFYNYTDLIGVHFPSCTSIDPTAFTNCTKVQSVTLGYESISGTTFPFSIASASLTSISFPECKIIEAGTFNGYKNLISAFFPTCATVKENAFADCTSLTYVYFYECAYIGSGAFNNCTELAYASFPECETIDENAFYNCTNLAVIVLGSSSVVNLINVNALGNTPITNSSYIGGFGCIYVTPSLVDLYRTDPRWTVFASRIEPIPEIDNLILN